MMKSKSMRRLWVTLGMFTAVLLMVLILPSFAASAETGDVPVTGISLNKTSSTLHTTQREQLIATVTPTNATNNQIVWTSSDTDVVTVSQTGTVTAIDFGEATVTATAADGSGVYATCHYMVNPYLDGLTFPSFNQDARRVQFQFRTATGISMVYIHVGNRIYYVNKPTVSTPYDQIVNGDHVKVSISYDFDTHDAIWSCQISLTPTNIGSTERIFFEMYNGTYLAKSLGASGFVFWDAKLMIGDIKPINVFNKFGYPNDGGCHYRVVDYFDHDEIHFADANETNLGTGSVVLQMKTLPNQGDMIYNIAFIVRIGDVTGNGNVGDGEFSIEDANVILSYSAHTASCDTMIFFLASDVDGDNSITVTDALAVLTAVSNGYDVTQRYYYGDAYLPMYYTESVMFQ